MSILENAYSADDVMEVLLCVGAQPGDIIFSHVSLGKLGLARGCRSTQASCLLLLKGIHQVIGDEGTFITPTFSYSFTKGENFDPETTPSTIGAFSEFFRTKGGVKRSIDPLFSVAGEGPMAEVLFKTLPLTSFGAGCLYDRLMQNNAIVVNFGLPIEFLTFLHFVEGQLGVPYRYNKMFSGKICIGGKWHEVLWEYLARIVVENTEIDLEFLKGVGDAGGTLMRADLGLGHVEAMRCRDLYRVIEGLLHNDVWSCVKGPAFSISRDNAISPLLRA